MCFVIGLLIQLGYLKRHYPDRRAEAEVLLGGVRDQIRIQHSHTGRCPTSVSSFASSDGNQGGFFTQGEYFIVEDAIFSAIVASPPMKDGWGRPIEGPVRTTRVSITARPKDAEWGYAVMTFDVDDGTSSIRWFTTWEELHDYLYGHRTDSGREP
jgi:hypothetical protein